MLDLFLRYRLNLQLANDPSRGKCAHCQRICHGGHRMGAVTDGKDPLRRTFLKGPICLDDALICQLQTELLGERATDLRLGFVYLGAGRSISMYTGHLKLE